VLYITVQSSTVLYITVQYSTVLYIYSPVQYSTVHYSPVQYSALYSTSSSTFPYSTVHYCGLRDLMLFSSDVAYVRCFLLFWNRQVALFSWTSQLEPGSATRTESNSFRRTLAQVADDVYGFLQVKGQYKEECK